jgi:hypothetical protein
MLILNSALESWDESAFVADVMMARSIRTAAIVSEALLTAGETGQNRVTFQVGPL